MSMNAQPTMEPVSTTVSTPMVAFTAPATVGTHWTPMERGALVRKKERVQEDLMLAMVYETSPTNTFPPIFVFLPVQHHVPTVVVPAVRAYLPTLVFASQAGREIIAVMVRKSLHPQNKPFAHIYYSAQANHSLITHTHTHKCVCQYTANTYNS